MPGSFGCYEHQGQSRSRAVSGVTNAKWFNMLGVKIYLQSIRDASLTTVQSVAASQSTKTAISELENVNRTMNNTYYKS